MKLKELAAKPKLVKIAVDDEFIVKAYGEPLDFWMWDRQDIPTFLKIMQLKEDQSQVFDLVKDVVLDEDGTPSLNDGEMLPLDIMLKVLEAVVKHLGNMKPDYSSLTPELMAWLTIDHAAKRYGVLPSVLMKSGDTMDLRCAEIAVGYESFIRSNPGVKTNHGFSQEELLNALKAAKEKDGR